MGARWIFPRARALAVFPLSCLFPYLRFLPRGRSLLNLNLISPVRAGKTMRIARKTPNVPFLRKDMNLPILPRLRTVGVLLGVAVLWNTQAHRVLAQVDPGPGPSSAMVPANLDLSKQWYSRPLQDQDIL